MNSNNTVSFNQKNTLLFLWQCAIAVQIITFFILFSKIRFTSNVLILHYNVIVGSDYIGKAYQLYLIPLVGLFFMFVNFILARTAKNNQLIHYLAAGVSLAITCFLSLAVIFILFIN